MPGLYNQLPTQSSVVKGLMFGTVAWLLGIGAPVAALVLHWNYGAILGAVYGQLMATQFITSRTHTRA